MAWRRSLFISKSKLCFLWKHKLFYFVLKPLGIVKVIFPLGPFNNYVIAFLTPLPHNWSRNRLMKPPSDYLIGCLNLVRLAITLIVLYYIVSHCILYETYCLNVRTVCNRTCKEPMFWLSRYCSFLMTSRYFLVDGKRGLR